MTVMVGDLDLDARRSSQPLALGSSALAGDVAESIGKRGELSASAVTEWKREADEERGRAEVLRVASTRSHRNRPPWLFIAGGAATVIAIVAIVALRGGDDSAKSDRVPAKHASAASRSHDVPAAIDPLATEPGSGAGSQMRVEDKTRRAAAAAAAVGPGSAEGDEPTDAPVEPEAPVAVETPTPPVTKPPPVATKRAAPTLGGKKVVLEYDNAAPKETPKTPVPVKGDDSASIGAARITYFNGNRKLFAGDADAAIKLYKQALAMYPGYVAAYRGLGLAHAQKGDKQNALKAFRTYVSAVPGAKDVALVKKRIATLQR